MSPKDRVGSARDDLLRRAVEHFAVHGIGDTSLRSLAAGIDTSHRMLLYHFGSREGLLSAVVDAVESGGRATLAGELAGRPRGPRARSTPSQSAPSALSPRARRPAPSAPSPSAPSPSARR